MTESAAGSKCGNRRVADEASDDNMVFYPEDDQFLIERDLTVRHYEVADTE